MNFSEGDVHNFHMLTMAFDNRDVAVVECQIAATGEVIPVICAVNHTAPDRVEFVPVAQLFRGDPYRFLNPPRDDGRGFFSQAELNGDLN